MSINNQNKKFALVTGASSGIGCDIAVELSRMGYGVILAARNELRLRETAKKLENSSWVVPCDVSKRDDCLMLYKKTAEICGVPDVVVNNAGFGLFGEFADADLDTELEMIKTNITGLHILTKLYLRDLIKRDSGYILNVASSAAFMPGPLMSTYYATKAYVLRQAQAIDRELRQRKSHVSISALCPGPVDTNFNKTANVEFALRGLKSADVAHYAVKQMFGHKTVIVPGILMKLGKFALRFIPDRLTTKIGYYIQRKKKL